MGPMEAYMRGYLDALDLIEAHKSYPIDAVVAVARDHLIGKFPEMKQFDENLFPSS